MTNPRITSMITSTGGEDVSGKSATNASDRYWRHEYAECIMIRHPTVDRVEFPEKDDIFIWHENEEIGCRTDMVWYANANDGRLVK